MYWCRDLRLVLLVGTIAIVLVLSASFWAEKRILEWQSEFASSQNDPTLYSTSLLIEHHRLLEVIALFARGDDSVTKAQVLERLDIYWSRHTLLESVGYVYDAPKITQDMPWLPPDSHSKVISESISILAEKSKPALLKVERLIKKLRSGNLQEYLQIRSALDGLSAPVATLTIASFERKRYMDTVEVALSERLQRAIRNALLVNGAGIVLLGYILMLYWRHKHYATEKLHEINSQLRLEIEESERLGRELSFRATHDSLSGLINRFGFNQTLDSKLSCDNGSHGLCFMDLDLFKVVNDTYGHATGDELIREMSKLLLSVLPDDAVVARIGGDEFVILICDCEQNYFEKLINNCCTSLNEYRFNYSGKLVDISGSFGAVYFNTAHVNAQTIMGIVDAACYEAKKAGGARVHFHHRGDTSFESRQYDLGMVANIQSALDKRTFRLYRQPILALQDDSNAERYHWEVLIRMPGDNNQLLAPSLFLDVAERYHLAARIDKWVIEETFAWLNAMHERYGEAENININLSGTSIGDDKLLAHVEKLTLSLEIPTENVCFEITESAAIGKHAREFLIRLKQLGYQLALDDFGSGFSSFGYLENLPVDFIKIDGLFIRDMATNMVHHEFVKSINDIGKVMGKQTVAEYVADAEVLNLLRDMGVDYAQGYHVARPSPMVMPEMVFATQSQAAPLSR
jgi:Amt family ammonium transporter